MADQLVLGATLAGKTCTKCERTFGNSGFYGDPRKFDGLRPWCKLCCKENADKRRLDGRGTTPAEKAAYARRAGLIDPSTPYLGREARLEIARMKREGAQAKADLRRDAAQRAREAEGAWKDWIENRAPRWWLDIRQTITGVNARGQPGSKRWYRTATPIEATEHRKTASARGRTQYWRDPQKARDRVIRYKHSNPDKVVAWQGKRGAQAAERNDRTLAAVVLRELFANAKVCPYDGLPFNGRTKALDHLVALSLGGVHSLINVVVCCDDCNHRKLARPFDVWVRMLSPPNAKRALRLYRSRYGCDPGQATMPFAFVAA